MTASVLFRLPAGRLATLHQPAVNKHEYAVMVAHRLRVLLAPLSRNAVANVIRQIVEGDKPIAAGVGVPEQSLENKPSKHAMLVGRILEGALPGPTGGQNMCRGLSRPQGHSRVVDPHLFNASRIGHESAEACVNEQQLVLGRQIIQRIQKLLHLQSVGRHLGEVRSLGAGKGPGDLGVRHQQVTGHLLPYLRAHPVPSEMHQQSIVVGHALIEVPFDNLLDLVPAYFAPTG